MAQKTREVKMVLVPNFAFYAKTKFKLKKKGSPAYDETLTVAQQLGICTRFPFASVQEN